MPRDAYFSFGDEEPDVQPVATADLGLGPLGATGVVDSLLGGAEAPPLAPTPTADRRRVSGRRRFSPPPARLAALFALTLVVVALLVHTLMVALGSGLADPRGTATTRRLGQRAAAPALAPTRPGIAAAAGARPHRHTAERERVQRRRSQTRRRARRHRERRPVERRNLSAGRAHPAPDVPAAEPTEAQAPPADQAIEASAAIQVPPAYTPPPEAAPEAAPEAPGQPRIRDGAHTSEFGL